MWCSSRGISTEMASPPRDQALDILAIAAHRDDVEQTCGGTLLKAAQRGQRTGILDLTQGEMGTRGTAEDRAREADDAARILGVSWRRALDIPDGRVENTWENRLKVASAIRETQPRVVILPYWKGRHPDHYTTSVLGYEACFLAGLAKLALSSQPANPQPRTSGLGLRATSSLQDHLRDALLRCTAHVRGRHQRAVCGEVRIHHGLQVAVQRSGSGQGSVPCSR